MADQAALAHHQEMVEAADMGVKGLDLAPHLVRGAGEDKAGVDRILDMCRTTLNVVGDLTAATFVARSEGYELLQVREDVGIG